MKNISDARFCAVEPTARDCEIDAMHASAAVYYQ